jgi:O-phosphoseryl-tRNA(Cys) synthetase
MKNMTNWTLRLITIFGLSLFVFACAKKANEEAVANQELITLKAEIAKQSQTINKAMHDATEKTLTGQQGRADLAAFKA